MKGRMSASDQSSQTHCPVCFGATGGLAAKSTVMALARASARLPIGDLRFTPLARMAAYSLATLALNAVAWVSEISAEQTLTARLASSTCTVGPEYCGAIFSAVCTREVVAPPISSGI